MKKALAIAGILALSITPTVSFADHLEPNESEIRSQTYLEHVNLRGRNLSGRSLFGSFFLSVNLSGANLSGAEMGMSQIEDTDLSRANLSGGFLGNCAFIGVNFTGTDRVMPSRMVPTLGMPTW